MSDAFDQAMSALGGGTGAAPAQPAAAAPSQSSPSGADPYGGIIQRAAQMYDVDPRLIRAVIQTESSGNPKAVSPQGAIGLMQLEPGTARGMGVHGDLTDPQTNIMAGTQYLSQMLGKYGDPQTALMAYHGGPDQRGWGPKTQAYPGQVLVHFQSQGAASSSAPAAPQSSQNQGQPDAFDSAMSAINAPTAPAQQPESPLQQFGHAAAGLADTAINFPYGIARTVDTALRRPFQSAQEAQEGAARDFNPNPVGNLFGVTNTPSYQGEGSQLAGQLVGGLASKGINAVAGATGANPADVAEIANIASLAAPKVPGAVKAVGRFAGDAAVATVASDLERAPPKLAAWEQAKATYAPQPTVPAMAGASGRGSVGAAGTSFADQARAEGVPDAIVQKIASQEQRGEINATAAGRHIEAGSLPVPVELTAGQATGDVNLLSQEQNMRGKVPELAQRFNEQNGQIAANLDAIRDRVAPDVNVPSGSGIGQALVDAYKQMDEPVQQRISGAYAAARNADGTSAQVDASQAMRNFESQMTPAKFRALPSRVQQMFAEGKSGNVEIPAAFDRLMGGTRPMTAIDLMDIDQALSGEIAQTNNPSVAHDIGMLREAFNSASINPNAGATAMAAFKDAQSMARARFQAMEADPAYKASINDGAPAGSPSPLADQFVQQYIAGGGGKAARANVQNMMQNLSGDPLNQQLMAAGLLDHIKQQAGIDLRTNTGNISQSGLNKALTNLDQKTGAVLGASVAQTLDTLGNVARYTQEQPVGSYKNNSNTLVAAAANATKSAMEGGANVAAHGVPIGTWTRQALAKRSLAKEVRQSLEPGAGVPLNSLIKKVRP